VPISAGGRFGLGLSVTGGPAAVQAIRVVEPVGEPIFNGQDLAGWWTPGNLKRWRVEDGQIVRTERAGDYLRTERLYGNFTFSFEYRMKEGTNAGLGLRTRRRGWPSSDGIELQMLDSEAPEPKGNHMALYGAVPPLHRAINSGEWNRVTVKADGWVISAWENGHLAQHYNTRFHPELQHRLLQGWLGFQDHGNWLRLRNLRVLEAPDGQGLDAWLQPPPPRATAFIIDRLMNSWLLAEDEGIRAGRVAKTIDAEQPGEHVLAELNGPGAVTRLLRCNDEGTLAFFFDGEPEPRLTVPAGKLYQAMPRISEHHRPVLTCLPYAKQLKIVLRDAKKTAWRIDHVTFPKEYELTSFQKDQPTFPRGWHEALIYRHLKFKWNQYHDLSVLPRLNASGTIGPKAVGPKLRVDGVGIVRYIKLLGDRDQLNNDHLRLQVFHGDEKEPAIDAPVRFWFPALLAKSRHHELVHFRYGGCATTMAMPFTGGITLQLTNSGDEPIHGMGLQICYEPADRPSYPDRQLTSDAVAKMMRLRGVFLPAGQDDGVLAQWQGAGRLIALAVERSGDQPCGVGQLNVDGQTSDALRAGSLDSLVGGSGDFGGSLSGRHGRLAWRHFWLAPITFNKSLKLHGDKSDARLALFYVAP
jgi:hypothetical protein